MSNTENCEKNKDFWQKFITSFDLVTNHHIIYIAYILRRQSDGVIS
jgi:hypothetical protein